MTDIAKDFRFNGDDYDIYVAIDGDTPQYIGSARTRTAAEQKASEYVIDYYTDAHTPEKAAQVVMETL